MKNEKLIEKYQKLNELEKVLYDQGMINIVGIDEVGRGPLAGPVTVGAVILNPANPIYGLDDSKKISKKKRILLNKEIKEKAKFYAVSSVTPLTIDKIGINNAIEKAMKNCLKKIAEIYKIDYILSDYVTFDLGYPMQAIVKGDQKSNSIAAASIIAKVHRDNYMHQIGKKYPEYDFENNVGYGTLKHREALKKYGYIDKIHRKSFEPIKSMEEVYED